MTMRSNLAHFVAALGVGIVVFTFADDVFARSGGGGGSFGGSTHANTVTSGGARAPLPGGSVQPPCRGPACGARAPTGTSRHCERIGSTSLGHGGGGGGGGATGHGGGGAITFCN